MREAVLLSDVYSVFYKGKERIRYAKKGEKVKVLPGYTGAVVVQKANGDRVPVEENLIQ